MDDLVTLLQIWGALTVVGVLLVSSVLVAAVRLGWAGSERYDDEADEAATD